MALDPAVAALAGTGLGAVLGGFSAWLLEGVRWKRQQSTRWDDVRRQIYGDILVHMQACVQCLSSAQHFGTQTSSFEGGIAKVAADRRKRLKAEEIQEANSHFDQAFSLFGQIDLLGSRELWRLAAAWHSVGCKLFSAAMDEDVGAWDDNVRQWDEAQIAFRTAARKELGIAASAAPPTPGRP